MGILVGILVGNMTHGSGSPADTDPRGSGCGFYGDRYPARVPAVHLPIFLFSLIKPTNHFKVTSRNCVA
jgi:hypothetical protein